MYESGSYCLRRSTDELCFLCTFLFLANQILAWLKNSRDPFTSRRETKRIGNGRKEKFSFGIILYIDMKVSDLKR